MVTRNDACWESLSWLMQLERKVRSDYFPREFSGRVYRMKFYLAQTKNKDLVPCTEVPADLWNLLTVH